MTLPKTIMLHDAHELHIDPGPGEHIQLAIKTRSRFGLHELSRIRLDKGQRVALQEALYLAGAKEAQ